MELDIEDLEGRRRRRKVLSKIEPDVKRDLQGKYRRCIAFSRLSRCILRDRRIDRIVLMNRRSKYSNSCQIAYLSCMDCLPYCACMSGAEWQYDFIRSVITRTALLLRELLDPRNLVLSSHTNIAALNPLGVLDLRD